MNYYTTSEEEPIDGSLESKWEPTADMNIIKSAIEVLTMISGGKDSTGPVLHVSFNKEGDGQTMSLRMAISTPQMTMNWENTDSENWKNSRIEFSNTSSAEIQERSRCLSTLLGLEGKPSSQDGRI